jgi:hypothetical protein
MVFNYRTQKHLKDNDAVLIKSGLQICSIDFYNLRAFVNKVDLYKKRNGKKCRVEHHFGKWIPFSKDLIKYREHTKTDETNDICVGDRESYNYKVKSKYLPKESEQEIINKY